MAKTNKNFEKIELLEDRIEDIINTICYISDDLGTITGEISNIIQEYRTDRTSEDELFLRIDVAKMALNGSIRELEEVAEFYSEK